MHKQIIFFIVSAFFMQPTLLMASAPPQAQATETRQPRCHRAECALGFCMGAVACSLVFGMLIAGWVDQSSSSSHHNATTDGIAPHTLAAHSSILTLKSKADLNTFKHAFKRQQTKPTTKHLPLKMRFARHNFNEAQKRNVRSHNKKPAKR